VTGWAEFIGSTSAGGSTAEMVITRVESSRRPRLGGPAGAAPEM
jgi:hypothetical protein